MSSPVRKSELFASLPAPWPADLLPAIRTEVAASRRKLVVLDDDPTGTQTVYGVPVLATWGTEELKCEFKNDLPCFYLLTNTRAFPAAEAERINQEIARNLVAAATKSERRDFAVVSRGDSTLRGHFPAETDALGRALADGGPLTPPVLLVPYFEAGGRYTVNNIHYVAEDDILVPAAETPFAKDAAFGFRNSDLREWVEEKTGGRINAAEVKSISLDDLRVNGPDAVQAKLLALRVGDVCIANAAAPRDLEVLAWAALQAENSGGRMIYRTAASFVAARLGLAPRDLWKPDRHVSGGRTGGLVIIGSYVPKTTQQLQSLLATGIAEGIEISVEGILDRARRRVVLEYAMERILASILAGRDVVAYTSRVLVADTGADENLAIGRQVSEALVDLLKGIGSTPRYLIAKGGITSSDLATHALGVKRAMVLGQILPGVPVWELGVETRFPGLPFIVFPGNVGGPDALTEVISFFNP